MRPLKLLFDSPWAARDIAFMLRGEYDGCNMVTLPSTYDSFALGTAIELTGAEFCFDGDHTPIVLPPIDSSDQIIRVDIEQSYFKQMQ